eukprot:EG_transcript_5513
MSSSPFDRWPLGPGGSSSSSGGHGGPRSPVSPTGPYPSIASLAVVTALGLCATFAFSGPVSHYHASSSLAQPREVPARLTVTPLYAGPLRHEAPRATGPRPVGRPSPAGARPPPAAGRAPPTRGHARPPLASSPQVGWLGALLAVPAIAAAWLSPWRPRQPPLAPTSAPAPPIPLPASWSMASQRGSTKERIGPHGGIADDCAVPPAVEATPRGSKSAVFVTKVGQVEIPKEPLVTDTTQLLGVQLRTMSDSSYAKDKPTSSDIFGRLAALLSPPSGQGEPLVTRLSKALSVALPVGAVVMHGPDWAHLIAEYSQLRAAASPEDLQAVTQFWLLFATTHPIVRPVLWLAELAGQGPGPELVGTPVGSLLLGTAAAVAIARNPDVRRVFGGATLALYLGAIGAGLAGTGNLGDYNLQLNDGVRGCPAYEEVRQPTMDGFDLTKYQGRWYEVAFHDYTQYSEVYDTTFDINLTPDRQRWLDDFSIKGPSPRVNPTTWDRSPVTNGAHYFLYGKVDPTTQGLLQESGFGVVFPNYIVDVQRAPDGGYTEAIQFQCLERGGVRVFEGINFLTRDPSPGPERLAAMHERAKAAGMYPYGASPEQMHYVEHTAADWQPVDNAAQRFWRWVGMERLLALVEAGTHSVLEDSVRS